MLEELLGRIFRSKKQPDLDQEHVWGILTPAWVHLVFKKLAGELQLPLGFMTTGILKDWLRENFELITSDVEEKARYWQHLLRQNSEKPEESTRYR